MKNIYIPNFHFSGSMAECELHIYRVNKAKMNLNTYGLIRAKKLMCIVYIGCFNTGMAKALERKVHMLKELLDFDGLMMLNKCYCLK